MEEEESESIGWWKDCVKSVGKWMSHKDKDKWLKDMRGLLCVMATVIATITFQSATNPPGGVWPTLPITNEESVKDQCRNGVCPGYSVLAVVEQDEYKWFLIYNTTCFISSLAVCLLLVSGFPLNHRFFTWLCSIGMCIIITSLTLTYLSVAAMNTPEITFGKKSISCFKQFLLFGLYSWYLSLLSFPCAYLFGSSLSGLTNVKKNNQLPTCYLTCTLLVQQNNIMQK
ncbi:hypothetical protein Fmac_012354 [Flemingia macrophylla]|uniref:PGG domain-containing protein n=1 Tax=Flemingia macrophylla TaxID=520843 RepID=A0ABD1MQX1_9FABA